MIIVERVKGLESEGVSRVLTTLQSRDNRYLQEEAPVTSCVGLYNLQDLVSVWTFHLFCLDSLFSNLPIRDLPGDFKKKRIMIRFVFQTHSHAKSIVQRL